MAGCNARGRSSREFHRGLLPGLLAAQVPEANQTALISSPFENGTLNSGAIQRDNNESATITSFYTSMLAEQPAYCSAEAFTFSGLSFAWTGSYMCDQFVYRYRIEENPSWLGLAVQVEMPELLYVNETLVANMSELGAPMFRNVVSYFNPIDPMGRALWINQSELMRQKACV